MKQYLILIAALLISISNTKAQRIITGKVIDQRFDPVVQVSIEISDTTLITSFNPKGEFKLSIPADTKSLIFGTIGYEPASINLNDSCNHLEIVLLLNSSYDFMSLKKVDRLRLKEFKKLPQLYFAAYQKGIFQSDSACYSQNFIPNYHRNK